jgi:hypothetical protein
MVSGSISLPFRGSFRLSLTVLVHYRSQEIFSLGRWSSQIRPGFHVSRPTWETNIRAEYFRVQDFHLLWCDFPDTSTNIQLCNLTRSLAANLSHYPGLSYKRLEYWVMVVWISQPLFNIRLPAYSHSSQAMSLVTSFWLLVSSYWKLGTRNSKLVTYSSLVKSAKVK